MLPCCLQSTSDYETQELMQCNNVIRVAVIPLRNDYVDDRDAFAYKGNCALRRCFAHRYLGSRL